MIQFTVKPYSDTPVNILEPLRGIEPRIADYKSAVIPFNYSGKLSDGIYTRESSVVHLSNRYLVS